MRQINYTSLFFLLLCLSGCIKPYNPVIDTKDENRYVVTGRVTTMPGWQEVEVTLSSPVGSPEYIPVSECEIKILDDTGNIFPLEEFIPGHYRVWMTAEYLVTGTSYKVDVKTPDGKELVSSFDKMPAGVELDTVYYHLTDVPSPVSGVTSRVMQFYVDINASGNFSQFYKWEIEETWEYHAARPAEYYYDGTFHTIDPPDYSHIICWKYEVAKNVFTLSTSSLAQNTYKQFPLHNIDGRTSRLGIQYSVLVRQFAMSEGAYNYWEQLRINSNEQGGLYEKQPLAIKGNLVDVNHPDQVVLGYFYAGSESSRRYFYKDIEGLELTFANDCSGSYLPRFGWKEFGKDDYPVYFYYSIGVVKTLSIDCVDCRAAGGTTVKPDFWPN